jgi:protein gp37
MRTNTVPLSLESIIIDAGTQARLALHQDTIDRYMEAITNGDKLPPMEVYTDGSTYWLVDGFHRFFAYKQAGRKQVQVIVKEGPLKEAVLAAAAANKAHDTAGLARTNKDKRHAVEMVLQFEDWRKKPLWEVAKHCGASHETVRTIRNELSKFESSSPFPDKTTGADGKQRPTKYKPRKEKDPEPERLPLTGGVQYTNGHDVKPWYTVEHWNALDKAGRLALFHMEPKGTFNKTDENVGWAKSSWNPCTGCEHNCPYCYARDIANRYYEGYGFTPVFHPARLHIPQTMTPPKESATQPGLRNVFVCSMADLFGKWVPKEWIEAIIDVCARAPQWNFLFLTKFPARLCEFSFPDNAWVGTSVDVQARVAAAEKAFRNISAKVKWLSCEPLLEPLRFSALDMFDWVVIGGASRSEQTPEFRPPRKWVIQLEAQALEAGCRIYEKENLYSENLLQEYPDAPDVESTPAALARFDYPLLKL